MQLVWKLEVAERLGVSTQSPSDQSEGCRCVKAQRLSLESSPSSSSSPQVARLTGVSVVCRQYPSVWALQHVVEVINDFADSSLNLRLATISHSIMTIALMKRLHAREKNDPVINDRFFRDWQFNQAANEAAAHGNLEILKWLTTEYSPGNVLTEAVDWAAANGHLEVVKWLYEEYPFVVVGFKELKAAAERSRLEVVKYLLAHRPSRECRLEPMSDRTWKENLHRFAIRYTVFGSASLKFVQWVVENDIVGDGWGLLYAARAGRLDVVQWLAGYLDRMFRDNGSQMDERYEEEARRHAEQDFDSDSDDSTEDGEEYGDDSDGISPDRVENYYDYYCGSDSEADENSDEDDMEDESGKIDEEASNEYSLYQFPQIVYIDELFGPKGFAVAKWLHEQNFSWLRLSASCDTLHKNKRHGEFVRWLHEHNFGVARACWIDYAASQGDFEIVKWYHENCSGNCTTAAMDGAAEHGHLEIIKWLHVNRSEGCSNAALSKVIANGHVDIAKWLLENRSEGNFKDAMETAALRGDLEIVSLLYGRFGDVYSTDQSTEDVQERELHTQRDDPFEFNMNVFAGYPNMSLPHSLLGLPKISKNVVDKVARTGHLAVLQFLLENRIAECSSSTMDAAAAGNQLEVVTWLHCNRSEGCTTRAMDEAAGHGHLDMVIWLHSNRAEGCTTRAMDDAIANNHVAVVKWLYYNRSEGASDYQIGIAAMNGGFDVVRWLTENCPHELFAQCTADAMDIAASKGDLRMVRYLHEHSSAGCTTEAMDSAAGNGHFEVMLYLHANRSEGCTDRAFEVAAESGWLEILRWLVFHYTYVLNHRNIKALGSNLLVGSWMLFRGLFVKGQPAPAG